VKPKILHVSQSTGGVETSIVLLLRHFDYSRFEHHLACPPGTTLEAKARELGVRVFPVKMVRGPNPIRDLAALITLVRLIRREGHAIVHGHSAKGGYLGRLAARLAGRRALYSPRGFSYLSQRGVARAFFLRLERWAVRWTDLAVTASESERRRTIEEVGFSPSRVVQVSNSIDLSEIEGIRSASSDPPVVLTAGRFAYQKNPEMFVRVAALVARLRPDVRFVWVGGGFAGPLEGRVREMVMEAGLSARFDILPWGPKRQTLVAIAGCTVFVLTSRFEGLGNATLEAMMLAKPAVVTDADGNRDLVRPGVNGFVVATDDDETMARRIVEVLENTAVAARMGHAGRTRVEGDFDIRKNVRLLEEVYAQQGAPQLR
jgi:glycosyltransferase involved in cell wall biosynthesis